MSFVEKMLTGGLLNALVFGTLVASMQPAFSATSESFVSEPVDATIISAQDGVPPGAETLSAGLEINLADGWKTYWRSPGEVGIPPRIDWSGSENVAKVDMLWPAPERFTAFGIENFGYRDKVVFPLRVQLKDPGTPVHLNGSVDLLVCSDVCVPQAFDLKLALPSGSEIDTRSAERIGTFLERVPVEGAKTGINRAIASIDENWTALTLEMTSSSPFLTPDVFTELGPSTALGKPDIRLSEQGTKLWAQVPILRTDDTTPRVPLFTVTDGERAFSLKPKQIASPPVPPFSFQRLAPGVDQLVWIAFIAFLGGVVLNVMPCVLPVLSIKLSSAMKAHGREPHSVRAGFLVAAAGVMTFMWMLAATLFALQQLGFAVGWGLQFQNPIFLALMFVVLVLFAANLFGVFEFRLPAVLQTRLTTAGGTSGYAADFATGFFGAILATPCSAPFLGTAITFALAGRGVDILIVFTALGIGLALPYLIVASSPGAVRAIPKPGKWMIWVKAGMALLLTGTALWLLWVLSSVASLVAAITIVTLSLVLVLVFATKFVPTILRAVAILLIALLPMVLGVSPENTSAATVQRDAADKIAWLPFDRGEIARRVSRGEVVLLDVTADWCLTCKVNKALVLEREPVLSALQEKDVALMQADWTRPSDRIARFLESNNRYGIPFNAVYGPGSPKGTILSEVLSSDSVLEALSNARKASASRPGKANNN